MHLLLCECSLPPLIISFVSSPTYQLSKHLCYLLRPLLDHTESTIPNSKQFSAFIATQEIAHEESLVSFDVVSLHQGSHFACSSGCKTTPGIGHTLCREVLSHRHRDDHTAQVLPRCHLSSFRGSFDRQIHGTAVGSPVSVTVANLVMEDVEQRALATFPNPPKFWKRYVDDTCCALAISDIDRFPQHINSEDGSISTSVYRKPTNTDRYLDFSSHHPQAHKTAVVRTLMNRAKVLPSSVLAHTDEEVQVTAALQSSGSPP